MREKNKKGYFQNIQKSHPYADLVSEDSNKNGPEDFDPVVKISNPHHSLTLELIIFQIDKTQCFSNFIMIHHEISWEFYLIIYDI